MISKLLSLYENSPAYFYFLDEYTGVPVVPGNSRGSLYPLVVQDSVDMVRKVLPLMLGGMILMRGEKAMSVLAGVLLNPSLKIVQSHWIESAKDIVGYLYSPQTKWSNTYLQDLMPLRDDLVDFIERGPSGDAPVPGQNGLESEWVVELSLIRMVVEMHDSNHSYAGLRPRRSGFKVLWTCNNAFMNPMSRNHLYHVEFKSLLDLKDSPTDKEEEALMLIQSKHQEHQLEFDDDRRQGDNKDSKALENSYELLFGELSMPGPATEDTNAGDSENCSEPTRQLWSRNQEKNLASSQPPKSSYASSPLEPISLLSFDDDLDLDGVLQLRILLDEQEAKLEFLREKIQDIESAEEELMAQEERISDMLDEIINQKDNLLNGPSTKGLSKARSLLLRICDLEDRVLCREVEVGQLKNDISCFEIAASQQHYESALVADVL